MPQLFIFVIVSAGIVLVSWPSRRRWRSHGFFRFFALEFLLALILLNLEPWFRDPFSSHQLISWLLLLASLIMAVDGFYRLRTAGRPKGGIDNTTVLVKRGVYRYIRHPLYGSLLLLGWGAFLKNASPLSGILALAASAFLVTTAKMEEAENLQKFGADYATYMRTTRMFIPFLI